MEETETTQYTSERQRGHGGLLFVLGMVCGIVMAVCAVLLAILLFGKRGIVDVATKRKLDLIGEYIDTRFYRTEVDHAALREGMYAGMVDALGDPYSVYYTEEDLTEIMSDIEGVYEGIGAYMMVTQDSEYPVVAGTMSGSPAERAGLMENDLLTAVEGESTAGLDLATVVSRVRGEHGTSVRLTILRGGESFDVEIVRDRIESPTVETRDPEDGIGYLAISEFDDVTPDQFAEGLAALKSREMQGLILDLRSNTGGNLDAVCDIARMLLPEGNIVYTLDRDGNRENYTCDGKHAVDFPIVVLTNGYTASASEILAGAIRDHGLGKLVGTTTYGKGVVQRIFRLDDDSAIKLTVENYYTPAGTDLNGVGLSPDVEVVFDDEAYRADGTDNQLQRGEEVLRELMRNRGN